MKEEKAIDEILISVIIPVFDVREYLRQCIDSVICQSHRNLEILLIDDGSLDGSAGICDEYAEMDSRIKVMHKENGGLSDARNVGLAHATGEYIGFVDADDFIESNMFELLLKLCVEKDVPYASCGFDRIQNGIEKPIPRDGHVTILDPDYYLRAIEYPDRKNNVSMSVWANLYRRDIIEGLWFPKGRVYEDLVFNPKAIFNAKKCVYYDESLYHYRIRDNSITNKKKYNKFISDRIPQYLDLLDFIEKNIPELVNYYRCIMYSDILPLLKLKNNYSDGDLKSIDSLLKKTKLRLGEIIKLKINLSEKIKAIIKHRFSKLYLYLKH